MRTLLISEPSSIGDYDVAVATDTLHPDYPVLLGMFEVLRGQHLDDVTHVFSQCFLEPELRHSKPLQFVDHTIGLLEALAKENDRLVIAGLGAGLVHSGISLKIPSLKVTSVEYDHTVVKLARKYWDFKGDVVTGDIKVFIKSLCPDAIDILFLNAFSVVNELSSQGLFEDIEWIDLCMSRISDDGFLVVNAFGEGEELIRDYMELRGYGGFIVKIGENKLFTITKS